MGNNSKFVGVTVSTQIYEFIQLEIKDGLYNSPSEWIRSACRDFYEKRQKDRLGGGALINPLSAQKKFKGAGARAVGPRPHNIPLYPLL